MWCKQHLISGAISDQNNFLLNPEWHCLGHSYFFKFFLKKDKMERYLLALLVVAIFTIISSADNLMDRIAEPPSQTQGLVKTPAEQSTSMPFPPPSGFLGGGFFIFKKLTFLFFCSINNAGKIFQNSLTKESLS